MEEIAIQAAQQLANGDLKPNRETKGLINKIINFALKYESPRNFIFGKARDKVMKMSQGLYPAPLRVYFLLYFGVLAACFFRTFISLYFHRLSML